MGREMDGKLEIDNDRGVIYFHVVHSKDAERCGTVTPLRICRLPKPIPDDLALDINHMHGCNWDGETIDVDPPVDEKKDLTAAVRLAIRDDLLYQIEWHGEWWTIMDGSTPVSEHDWLLVEAEEANIQATLGGQAWSQITAIRINDYPNQLALMDSVSVQECIDDGTLLQVRYAGVWYKAMIGDARTFPNDENLEVEGPDQVHTSITTDQFHLVEAIRVKG